MYKCDECGKIFDEPAYWTESYGERMHGCPYCYGNYDDFSYADDEDDEDE